MIASVPFAALAEATGPVEGVEYVVWDGAEPPPRDDIELVVLDYRNARMTLDRLDELPAIAVVQTQTAGVDGIAELMPDGVLLANARGVHDDATAELALGLTLASLRGIDEAVRDARPLGARAGAARLADSHVTVLGYGSIGRALASRLLACGAVVTARRLRAAARRPGGLGRDRRRRGLGRPARRGRRAPAHRRHPARRRRCLPGAASPTARSSSTWAADRCWTRPP